MTATARSQAGRGRAARAGGTALGCLILLAAGADVRADHSLSLTAAVGLAYDSNLLQYSDGQISDFEQALHPARYSIDTRDDGVFNPSLALGWEMDHGRGRKTVVRLKGEGDFHVKNGTADYHALSASWRETFRGDRRVGASYYTAPRYYLRQLFDEDWVSVPASVRYRRAEFQLDIASASTGLRLGRRARIDAAYQFERRTYRAPFGERDSHVNQEEARLAWGRLPHRGALEIRAGYRASKARAEDADEPRGSIADDPDLSYHGIVAGAGGRVELLRSARWRMGWDLDYDLETRDYDSKRPNDRYHFGRTDALHTAETGIRLTLPPHWSARGFSHFETNHASLGQVAPTTADAGSYRQHQVGLAIQWTGDLWPRGSREGEGQD